MSSTQKPKLTPMMEQYTSMRSSLPANTLLLFRLGDFYEMFNEDAEMGARILGITLTQRHGTPMAGIPYHAAQSYVHKLLAAGKKVAFCEQTEAPQAGKLVKREITRILTPGTTLEDNEVSAQEGHYLLALEGIKNGVAASWLDLTTGHFQISFHKDLTQLLPILHAIDPKEIIFPEKMKTAWGKDPVKYAALQELTSDRSHSELPKSKFDSTLGRAHILKALGVETLEGFGIEHHHPAIGAAGALITYASENLCKMPQNLSKIQEYVAGQTLLIDPNTLRHLEIFRSSQNTRKNTLISAMGGSVTAAGSRLLESWLAAPTLNIRELRRRQQCVGELIAEPVLASEVQYHLKQTRDIIRIVSRLQNRLRSPRELGAISETLAELPQIVNLIAQFKDVAIPAVGERIDTLDILYSRLKEALADELPADLAHGGYIRTGFNAELDEFRTLTHSSKSWLLDFERQEQASTGIKNLKIKYNNAFGYFIEVTKSNLNLVPDHYVRKQTMTNAERYYTEALKQKEKEILHAEEKALSLEQTLFKSLVAEVLKYAQPLEETAHALAEIDLLIGWATLARQWNYCKPTLDEHSEIEIDAGRHPVVEQSLMAPEISLTGNDAFVPNDTSLSSGNRQIALITGPNMAGKSTYIRQVALITLMAQVGSWVPAKSCRIGLVDRIFSRIGASDELSKGQSTFMVEMHETANILNNSTAKSLIILDEIGRGTSTYDGLSIAWSVIEHLHGSGQSGAKTLFATHYHELTQLEKSLPRLNNYSVAVKEWNGDIIFVRQVIPGPADRSYGIHVARLAGMPFQVIERAEDILAQLENTRQKRAAQKAGSSELKKEKSGQMEFF